MSSVSVSQMVDKWEAAAGPASPPPATDEELAPPSMQAAAPSPLDADSCRQLLRRIAVQAAETAQARSRRLDLADGSGSPRVIAVVFEHLLDKYYEGIAKVYAATTGAEPVALPDAWGGFLRSLEFEPACFAVLRQLAKVNAEDVVATALRIEFKADHDASPLLREAMSDLTDRVAARVISASLTSTKTMSSHSVGSLLDRAIAAYRTEPTYADDWAKAIGIISVDHLDAVLSAFKTEFQRHESKSSIGPQAAEALAMMTYVRVVLAGLTEEENRTRIVKVLNIHRDIFANKKLKGVPPVSVAQLTVLDVALRQWGYQSPLAPETLECLYRRAEKLSHTPQCKAPALKLMATILERSQQDVYLRQFEPFLRKRVLRHVDNPRKVAHCLRILLRVLRGPYQSPVHYHASDATAANSIGVHPRSDDSSFHPYACTMREELQSSIVALVTSSLFNKKVLQLAWPRYQMELVEIVMQLACIDVDWVIERIVLNLLSLKRFPSAHLLAFAVTRRLADHTGPFQKFHRRSVDTGMLRTLTDRIETMLGKALGDIPYEQSREPLQIVAIPSSIRAADLQCGTGAAQLDTDYEGSAHGTNLDAYDADGDSDDRSLDGSPYRSTSYSYSTATFTLRMQSGGEFPFLQTVAPADAQTVGSPGLGMRRRSAPTIGVAPSMLGRRNSVPALGDTANPTSHGVSPKQANLLQLAESAMKAVATLPSEASCINAESATYIPRWILHSSASLALCASSAMQEMCAHCSSEWFPAITESCAGYLANSIERHDISSVTTLLLQLAANVECWSCKERTESISTSDFKALQTLDATALAYLAHESAVVRRGAYRLLTANQHAYEGVGTSGKTWCLGSHIEQNDANLGASAALLLFDYHKSQYPGEVTSPAFTPKLTDILLEDSIGAEAIAAGLASLINNVALNADALPILEQAQSIVEAYLSRLLVGESVNLAETVSLSIVVLLSIRPKAELALNDTFLNMWKCLLAMDDAPNQNVIDFALCAAHVDHLALLLLTLNQARAVHTPSSTKQPTRSRKHQQQQSPDRACVDRAWAHYLVALSTPQRLRHAFAKSPRVRSLFLDLCRFGITRSAVKWARHPSHLSARAQFLDNVCFALRRRHKYEGVDFSGPFLEADLPEWIQEDRALTLVELRAWTECGEVTSPNAEDLLSFIKTQWSMSIEESLAKDKSRRGISDKERAAKLVESQAHMNKKLPKALLDMRTRAFWCASRLLSLGPTLSGEQVDEGGWVDWALRGEALGVPILQMFLCFHWHEMRKLLDRLYWASSQKDPLARNLFAGCASQIVPVLFGLSAAMQRHELEDCVPLTDGDVLEQNQKRPLIHEILAPLLVCAIFHLGSPSRDVSQTAASMLARLCDTLVPKSSTAEQTKALAMLRTHHPDLQSQIVSIRCKNAMFIARAVADLCHVDVIALILQEAVLRWGQFHNKQWQQKQWLCEAFEPFFLALPLRQFASIAGEEAAQLLLEDMVNVTRSLVRDDSPALQALLNIWQSIAGARADPHRNGNVREICEFLLDQSARFLDDERYSDYIEAARLIAVELHRHSSLAVLDCLLQRFETLDVSLQAQSDPVAALRTPCTLLSAIIGSRFQTCRARLPAILQHIFVWLPFPGSPCSEVLHDILHFLRHSDPGTLTGLIRPIPCLQGVQFQWSGTSLWETQAPNDAIDDAAILKLFDQIAQCTAAIEDSSFIVPVDFVCNVVKRWAGPAIAREWSQCMLRFASGSARPDLSLTALRTLTVVLPYPDLSTVSTLGRLLTTAITAGNASTVRQILAIYSRLLTLIVSLQTTYDVFRVLMHLFYQSSALLSWSDGPSDCYFGALRLTQALLSNPCLGRIIQSFSVDISSKKTSSTHLTVDLLQTQFAQVGAAICPVPFPGLQPILCGAWNQYSKEPRCLDIVLELLASFWTIPCNSVVDVHGSGTRALVNIVSVIPWLHSQTLSPTENSKSSSYCLRLAQAIDDSHVQWQFAEVADSLRLYAQSPRFQAQALASIASLLSDAFFPRQAKACADALRRVMNADAVACLHVAALFLDKSPRVDRTVLLAFEPLLEQAVGLLSRAYGDSKLSDAVSHLLHVACVVANDVDGNPGSQPQISTPTHDADTITPAITTPAVAALLSLVADPTGVFGATPPYAGQSLPTLSSSEGAAASSPVKLKHTRIVLREEPSEDGTRAEGAAAVQCTLANLLDKPHLNQQFRKYVAAHGDARGLVFYEVVMTEFCPAVTHTEAARRVAWQIANRFLVDGAPERIDINALTRNEVLEQLRNEGQRISPTIFNRAVQDVKNDLVACYTMFCDSPDCERMIRSGQLIAP
ncbi:RGS domain-containing protein [Plasmodiophora brassicae]